MFNESDMLCECIHCGNMLDIPDSMLGKDIVCLNCRGELNFPDDFPFESYFYTNDFHEGHDRENIKMNQVIRYAS